VRWWFIRNIFTSIAVWGGIIMGYKARLLIVDDEIIALKNLEHVLRKEGYDIVATDSGSEALKLLEKEEFSVLLTDLLHCKTL